MIGLTRVGCRAAELSRFDHEELCRKILSEDENMKNITLRLNAEIVKNLKNESERKGIPVIELITLILYGYFQSVVQ